MSKYHYISNTSFLASIIEVYGCLFNGRTNITNSSFSSGQQPYTIAICNGSVSDSYLGRSRHAVVSDTIRQVVLDKVNLTDLKDYNLPIPQLPFLCSLSSPIALTEDHPTDIHIGPGNQHIVLNITTITSIGAMALHSNPSILISPSLSPIAYSQVIHKEYLYLMEMLRVLQST